jgi:hypothetical protein
VSGETPNSNLLYHNEGNGTFTKVTSGSLATEVHTGAMYGSAWADYDNDGFIDLFVATTDSQDLLYRNNGAGGFDQIFAGPVPNQTGGVSLGSAWGDYNNDAKLDLFVATDFGKNLLYRNDGNGEIAQITGEAVGTDGGSTVPSIGCAWGDYNNDGLLDLFVSNGRDGAPSVNFLYQNTGDGNFARITSGAIATDTGNFDGCAWGDYDNDGYPDLFVCNFLGNNLLYRNSFDQFRPLELPWRRHEHHPHDEGRRSRPGRPVAAVLPRGITLRRGFASQPSLYENRRTDNVARYTRRVLQRVAQLESAHIVGSVDPPGPLSIRRHS